jgi:sulfur relay protein TusB/DsrH
MLHIFNQFPVDSGALKKTASGDTVLFIKNAVLAVKRDTQDTDSFINKTFAHINLCVLKTDLKLIGISTRELLQGVTILDEQDFRNMTHDNMAIRSWN